MLGCSYITETVTRVVTVSVGVQVGTSTIKENSNESEDEPVLASHLWRRLLEVMKITPSYLLQGFPTQGCAETPK